MIEEWMDNDRETNHKHKMRQDHNMIMRIKEANLNQVSLCEYTPKGSMTRWRSTRRCELPSGETEAFSELHWTKNHYLIKATLFSRMTATW